MAPDVIVIGAGWGGLTAAAILAHNGIDVLVLESTGHIGGRSACDIKDGFIVDYGIHIISYAQQGACAAAFREIGRELDLLPIPRPQVYRENGLTEMPTGVGSFLGAQYLSFADKMIIGHGVRKLIEGRNARLSDIALSDFLPGKNREAVRNFFSLLATMGLVCPFLDVASAGELSKFLRKAMSSKEKISYPRGGMRQINEGFADEIRKSGEIRLNSRVKSIKVDGAKAVTLKSHEDDLSAKAVIFAAPVQKLPELVDGDLPVDYRQRCRSLQPTAGISMDLCLNKVVSDLDACFITEPPVMIGQFTSNIDPSTAPEGKQLGTFFYPLRLPRMDDRAALEVEQKRFMDTLEKMFPGMMESIEWQRVLRMKMVDGFEPRVGQTQKDRPGTRVPGVDNFFLAGDCVGVRGKGGDVAFNAGIEAAHAVLDHLG